MQSGGSCSQQEVEVVEVLHLCCLSPCLITTWVDAPEIKWHEKKTKFSKQQDETEATIIQ